MDLMNKEGFELDFKNGVLKTNGEELVMHSRDDVAARVVLAIDTTLPNRAETVVEAFLEGKYSEGSTAMLEPGNEETEIARGVLIGKTIFQCRKVIPVRVMNVNYYPVTLRKGTVLEESSCVSSVICQMSATESTNNKDAPQELIDQLVTTRPDLTQHQRNHLKQFLGKYHDVFEVKGGLKG